jgi:hypothetical protein
MKPANWGETSDEPYANGEPRWNWRGAVREQQEPYANGRTGMKPASWGETSNEPYENGKLGIPSEDGERKRREMEK